MFTNQFDQKIYADWVSFSVRKEELPELIAQTMRGPARDSNINIELEVDEETSTVSKITVTNVTEENKWAVKSAFGIADVPQYDSKFVFNDGSFIMTGSNAHEAILFVVDVMLDTDCHECPYRLDEDGDFILSMRFYDFIEKSFGF